MNKSNCNFVNNSFFRLGQPWRQQYYINDLQSNNIVGWTTGEPLPDVLSDSQAIVTKNRVYLLGGFNNVSRVSTIYTAFINNDGTLGKWVIDENLLPSPLSNSQVIVIKNRVYLLGGIDKNWTHVPTVYTASISDDGTLGVWTTEEPLPIPLSSSQAIVTKNRIYLLGGYSNSIWTPIVYTASINSDGTLGKWTTVVSLPSPLSESQAIITKNRVYLLGGYNDNGNKWSFVSTVYTAPINSNGTLGEWTIGKPLPSSLGRSQSIITRNRVYLLGGIDNSWNYTSIVYTASVNKDGTLGAWTTGTPLPGVLSRSQVIVTKSRIYLLGGYNSSGCVATVYTAPIAGGLNDYSAYYN